MTQKEVDELQQRLGTEQRLARTWKHRKREKWQQFTSKKKHYLRFLSIVFSQEDGHPKVR